MDVPTDIELEQRAADGDRDAFGALYERHSGRVYDFLLRMVREPADAADLMQETFIRALRSMREGHAGKAQFGTWLFTIARNLALTRMERAKRTEPLATEEDESAYYRFDPDRLENPEAAAQAFEVASLVWEASEALDPKQRTLLDLHVRQGLDSAEIATVLGVTKGNAYTMVSRLKDHFASAVAGLVMFRVGRRNCAELNGLLEEQGATEISPEVRKLIERHTQSCDTCQRNRRELVSAPALLRALVPMPLLPHLANRVCDGAWADVSAATVATAATAAGGLGASTSTTPAAGAPAEPSTTVSSIQAESAGGGPSTGHGSGSRSAPLRAIRALPGPTWLPAVALVIIAALAVPPVALSMRSGGGTSGGNAPDDAAAGGTLTSVGVATATVAAVVTAPAADANFDGGYTIALAPGDERCGTPSIHGLRLVIQGDSATLTSASGEMLSGSAITQDRRLSIRLGITREQGSKWVVELSGDLDDSGNIRGDSESGGVFPGGRTGFACNYPFTANRDPVASASSADCPDSATLLAVWWGRDRMPAHVRGSLASPTSVAGAPG